MNKLALLGGVPIRPSLPDHEKWPVSSSDLEQRVLNVLRSGNWGTLGSETEHFARRYADYCQSKFCLPALNGTVCLEMIFRALGIGRGDEVILPPYTFTASASSIAMVGALPVFADIDPETYNIDANSAEACITSRTRAILGVHLGGRPFDVDAITTVARRHGLVLIEDAAHAHGSEWKGRRTGSLADAASFSFQNSKNLCCGEGGAITTDKQSLYETLWGMHHNGRAYGDLGYDHPILGTDARITEFQAAVLDENLKRLDADISRRSENSDYLTREITMNFPFLKPMRQDDRITRNSLHLMLLRYDSSKLMGISREVFLQAWLAEHACIAGTGYCSPIYKMRMLYTDAFTKASGIHYEDPTERLPVNEKAASQEGMWINHASLLGNRQDMDLILESLNKIATQASDLKNYAVGGMI